MRTLISNAKVVNEGLIFDANVLISDGFIDAISSQPINKSYDQIIDAQGKYLLPGIIDDQVHFREPGLTHKATIYSESRAGVAGGVTSYMEMPNTIPPASTIKQLEEKYEIASTSSLANYSFYLGASHNNIEEIVNVNTSQVCGIKIFMGSSTGDLLVDDDKVLNTIFKEAPLLIAIHSENDKIIKRNLERYKSIYGENIPPQEHENIRNVEACYQMTSYAVSLAKRYGTKLHVLHISNQAELELFTNQIPLDQKLITCEACVHHLWFDSGDYASFGNLIKCNPSIKEASNRKALLNAVLDNTVDVIATDHAPHTWEEKQLPYLQAPSGIPLLQHSLNVMLQFYHEKKISLVHIVKKMSHDPATLFQIDRRGFIREGYWADLVLLDINKEWEVNASNIYHKCHWSPFEKTTFKGLVTHTLVSGHLAYEEGLFNENNKGKRLLFNRK